MIESFRDHAANERTYLAWVRTGIAVSAFGFVIEKFELFVAELPVLAAARTHASLLSAGMIRFLSIVLMVAGITIVALATVHFRRTRRAILASSVEEYRDRAPAYALSGLLVASGVVLLVAMLRL